MIDTKDWVLLPGIFADDAIFDIRGQARVRSGAERCRPAPIIEILGEDRATAIWPCFGYLDDHGKLIRGYDHYHEERRRIGEGWLIDRHSLTRPRLDGDYPTVDI